ncbi:hypothetical protein SD80_005145 [Scytonema tolypothrichoides VB-61278]|nr:hypothetical protein SD80_005145 [Scytonema tolypothrichoides VB-61278]
MCAFSSWLGKRLQWLCCLGALCLVCLVMGWSPPLNTTNRMSSQLEQQNVLLTHEKQLGELMYSDIPKNFLAVEKFQRAHTLRSSLWEHLIRADSAIKKDIRLAQKLRPSGIPFFVMNAKNLSGGL